jgi:hypothetical protein
VNDRGNLFAAARVGLPVSALAPPMPEPENPERQKKERQEDDVAGRDEEDEKRDPYADCECSNHRLPRSAIGVAYLPPGRSRNRQARSDLRASGLLQAVFGQGSRAGWANRVSERPCL